MSPDKARALLAMVAWNNGCREQTRDDIVAGQSLDSIRVKAFDAVEAIQASAIAERWQPIETAPKDGSRIILWTRTDITADDREYVETVCESEHVVGAQVGRWEEASAYQEAGWHKELIGEPTHWQPLPGPPTDHHLASAGGAK